MKEGERDGGERLIGYIFQAEQLYISEGIPLNKYLSCEKYSGGSFGLV